MNCENCGAPLQVINGADCLQCDFCDTVRLVASLAATDDSVRLLENELDCGCPNCREPLVDAVLENRPVAACPKCLGFLMDRGELREIVNRRRLVYQGPNDEPARLDQAALARRRDCPICAAPMESYPYCGPGNVVIDGCSGCEKLWLDCGELASMERAPGPRRPDVKKPSLEEEVRQTVAKYSGDSMSEADPLDVTTVLHAFFR